jgi:hypothetical protein
VPHCRATPLLRAGAAAIGGGWLERRGEKWLYISYSAETCATIHDRVLLYIGIMLTMLSHSDI